MNLFESKRRPFRWRVGLALAAALIGVHSAAAGELLNKPVYLNHTKSYFELVRIGTGYSTRGATIDEINWQRASDYAAGKKFKGVGGRLAVVKDKETQQFLMKTFQPRYEVWIGLRYFCSFNKLMWTTGEEHPREAFANWASPWKVGYACHPGQQYAGIFAVRAGDRNYGRWQAQGIAKEFYELFVEYPTGAP